MKNLIKRKINELFVNNSVVEVNEVDSNLFTGKTNNGNSFHVEVDEGVVTLTIILK